MDCSYMTTPRSMSPCCSQMITPVPEKKACGCGRPGPLQPSMPLMRPMMPPPMQPMMPPPTRQVMPPPMRPTMPPSSMPSFVPVTPVVNHNCPDTSMGGMERYPVGMGYIPWQQWQQTYSIEKGLSRGTIFPDLDLPFMMGRCR